MNNSDDNISVPFSKIKNLCDTLENLGACLDDFGTCYVATCEAFLDVSKNCPLDNSKDK
jgi:hypothetical protein